MEGLGRTTRMLLLALVCACAAASNAAAQMDDEGLQVFGYFQTRLSVDKRIESQEEQTTFTVQHLNLFLRRPIGTRWTSFVNFEAINSYSSQNDWGSFNLEEAWVSYRRGPGLTVKMGLLIPRFNRLNEIKNRTPLLPYIIRPLVYESSLANAISIEQFVPHRAYLQVSGSRRVHQVRLDYAVYSGNSEHIVTNELEGAVSGTDSSDAFLGGGRIGLRYEETSMGFSFTHEKLNMNDFLPGAADTLGVSYDALDEMSVIRWGTDFYTQIKRLTLEFEYIRVKFDEDIADMNLNKRFGYGTVGYYITDKLYGYAGYWEARENFWFPTDGGIDRTFRIGGIGFAYEVNERVKLKSQFGEGRYETTDPDIDLSGNDFEHTSVAVSVFF